MVTMKFADSLIPSVRVKEYGSNGVYKGMMLVSPNTLSECSKSIVGNKILYADPIVGCYYESSN